nr:hypothetical protein [Sedimentitalea nanhaiensis]
MAETLEAKAVMDRQEAFPTVSRDTNLPMIDRVQGDSAPAI